MTNRALGIILVVFSLAACGKSHDSEGQQSDSQSVVRAEEFIDAFYSFNSDQLLSALSSAKESIPSILYYQGWAEGGNYEVVERKPCELDRSGTVSCPITVKDDLIGALGIDINVTDTFHVTISDGEIVSVTTSSNDPQEFYDAQEWVENNRSELIDEPCRGFFNGGPTPDDCVRAMVKGYTVFATIGGVSGANELVN